MKKLCYYIILLSSCTANSYGQQLAAPTIDVSAGFYSSNVDVSITHPEPGVTLFYTLNGSEPTPTNFVYTGPITLASRIGEANNYSQIPTNPSFTYPVGDYTAQRANNRGWLSPNGEVFKMNILKVKAYKAGFVPSPTVTKTISVDANGANLYDFPILSFVVDSIDLFSGATGIYHYGDHPMGNYGQKGVAWERIAHFEYFDENGNLVIDQNVRTRIHGGGTRHSTKKNFRVYAEYDTVNNFKYPFFEDFQLEKFKRILIRAGGHRPDCFPRDDLANLITKGLNGDQQHYKHIILFVNGEYWGIHSIKERVDNYFFQNQYGIDDNDITVLDQEYDLQGGGHSADSLEMVKIETFADTADMSNPANYQWVADRIDMDNYIDYMGSEIFLSNEDWVFSNIVLWRKNGGYDPTLGPGQDGKFRWCFYDFDGAFGGSCSNAYYTVNTLEKATVSTGLYAPYTRLFRGLLSSEIFRTKWINRVNDLMNSHFKQPVLQSKLDEMYNVLTPEMMESVERWRYPSEADNLADRALEIPSLVQWDTSFYYLDRFAVRRQRKVREHIMDMWGYPDTNYVQLDVNDQSMGSVKINTIRICSSLPGVTGSVYPWVGQYIDSVECTLVAIPQAGYEFVEWQESGITTDTIYWMPDGDSAFTAIFQPRTDFDPVVINEVMPSNSNYLADNFAEYDDWLELFNPNPYPLDLSDWTIQRDTIVWTIPEGTMIDANSYKLIWHDNQIYQGDHHANFKLPNSTNTIYLYAADGGLMDFLIYPETLTDNSFGRYPNGSGTFSAFSYPTPLQNNDISTVEENEILTDLTVYPNPTSNSININITTDFMLYSLDGKLLLVEQKTNQIDLSGLENGTYILKTKEGQTAKITVQK